MNDMIPDSTNRIASIIGLLLHPFLVAVITLLIVLSDLPLTTAIKWTTIISISLIMPLTSMIIFMKHRQQYTYQRHERGRLYLIGWLSIAFCLLIIILFDGPDILQACMAALLVWTPAQAFINARFTKVSTHVAVLSGCAVGVLWIKAWYLPVIWLTLIGMIALVAWARIVTRHHTLQQVLLGVLTGTLSVSLVFMLML